MTLVGPLSLVFWAVLLYFATSAKKSNADSNAAKPVSEIDQHTKDESGGENCKQPETRTSWTPPGKVIYQR